MISRVRQIDSNLAIVMATPPKHPDDDDEGEQVEENEGRRRAQARGVRFGRKQKLTACSSAIDRLRYVLDGDVVVPGEGRCAGFHHTAAEAKMIVSARAWY